MLRFRTKTTLNVVEGFDEKSDTVTEQCDETFKAGEVVDADVYYEEGDSSGTVDIQFADGSIAQGVPRDCIQIM